MPPITQNRKTYIVSTQQLLAWKRIKKEAEMFLGWVKILSNKDSILEIDNCSKIEKYDINGKII